MKSRTIIVSLTAVLVIAGSAYFVLARAARCDEITEPPVRSPGGQSVATTTFKACPTGLLSTTTCSVSVVLSSGSAASHNRKSPFFELVDASEVPTLTWVNEHELRLRVNDIGDIQASKRQVDDIRISYTVPKWIWSKLETFEAERLRSERESQNLADSGRLSKEDLRASIAIEEAVAEEHAKFRRWVMANATEDDQPQ